MNTCWEQIYDGKAKLYVIFQILMRTTCWCSSLQHFIKTLAPHFLSSQIFYPASSFLSFWFSHSKPSFLGFFFCLSFYSFFFPHSIYICLGKKKPHTTNQVKSWCPKMWSAQSAQALCRAHGNSVVDPRILCCQIEAWPVGLKSLKI